MAFSIPVLLRDSRSSSALSIRLSQMSISTILQQNGVGGLHGTILELAATPGPQILQITNGAVDQAKIEVIRRIQQNGSFTAHAKTRVIAQIETLPKYDSAPPHATAMILPLVLVHDSVDHAKAYLEKTPNFHDFFKVFLTSISRIKSKDPQINDAVTALSHLSLIVGQLLQSKSSGPAETDFLFPDVQHLLVLMGRDEQYRIAESYTDSFRHILDWISANPKSNPSRAPPIALVELVGKYSDMMPSVDKMEKLQKCLKKLQPVPYSAAVLHTMDLILLSLGGITTVNNFPEETLVIRPQVEYLLRDIRALQEFLPPSVFADLMEIAELIHHMFRHQSKFTVTDWTEDFWRENMLTFPQVVFTTENVAPRFDYIRRKSPKYESILHHAVNLSNDGTVYLWLKFLRDTSKYTFVAATFLPDVALVMETIRSVCNSDTELVKEFLMVVKTAFPTQSEPLARLTQGSDAGRGNVSTLAESTMPFGFLPTTTTTPFTFLDAKEFKQSLQQKDIEFTGLYQPLPIRAVSDPSNMSLSFSGPIVSPDFSRASGGGIAAFAIPTSQVGLSNDRSFQGKRPVSSQEPHSLSAKVQKQLEGIQHEFRHRFKLNDQIENAVELVMLPVALELPTRSELTGGDEYGIQLLDAFLRHAHLKSKKKSQILSVPEYVKHLLTIRAESELSAHDSILATLDLWRFVEGNIELFLRIEFVLSILKFYKIAYSPHFQQFLVSRVEPHARLDYTDLLENIILNQAANVGLHVLEDDASDMSLQEIGKDPTKIPFGVSNGKTVEIGFTKGPAVLASGRSLWGALAPTQGSLQMLAAVESVRRLLWCVQHDSHVELNPELMWAVLISMLHVSSGFNRVTDNNLAHIMSIIETTAQIFQISHQGLEDLVLRVLSQKEDGLSDEIFHAVFPVAPWKKAYLCVQKYSDHHELVAMISELVDRGDDVLSEFRNFIFENYAVLGKIMDQYLVVNQKTKQDRNIIFLGLVVFLGDAAVPSQKCFYLRKALQEAMQPITVLHLPGLETGSSNRHEIGFQVIHFPTYVQAFREMDSYQFGRVWTKDTMATIPNIAGYCKTYLNTFKVCGVFNLVVAKMILDTNATFGERLLVRAYLIALNATLIIAHQSPVDSDMTPMRELAGVCDQFPSDFWDAEKSVLSMAKLGTTLNVVLGLYYDAKDNNIMATLVRQVQHVKKEMGSFSHALIFELCENLAFLLQVNNMCFTARELRKRPSTYVVKHVEDFPILLSETQKVIANLL